MVMNLSTAPVAESLSVIIVPFKSVAARSIVYAPLAISVEALAHAAKAPASILRVAVTVNPAVGIPLEFTITKVKFGYAVFFFTAS